MKAFVHSVSSLFKDEKDCRRPFLDVSLGDIAVCGLLDTGSSVTILGADSHKYLIEIGYTLHQNQSLTLSTANSSTVRTIGYMSLPFKFNNRCQVIRAVVAPDIGTSLILGMDFVREFDLAPEILKYVRLESSDVNWHSVSEVRVLHPFTSLTENQQSLANKMIESFEKISTDVRGLGRTSLISQVIDTGDHPPVKQRYYPLSPARLALLNEEVDRMLELGVIKPSKGGWNNPTIFVPKSDGTLRFCLDSRKLNSITKPDAYPLPRITTILDSLRDANYLSSIDLSAAFWQIPLDPSSQEKCSFTVPGRGFFSMSVCPFGMRNSRLVCKDLLINCLTRRLITRYFAI